MLLKKLPILIITLLTLSGKLYAQTPCTTLGQNPSTAFPVCGTSVFFQNSVPICESHYIYVPGCSLPGDSNSQYQNKNPFWYRFTCFQSGTLCFVIVPNAPNEDYDWQLFDITGHNPDDVYTDTTLVVSGNWSGSYGTTGASATGVNFIQCASNPDSSYPTFALSPNIIQGHNYILLISHFSDTQQGYSLSFGGGTAVITDTLPPHLGNASTASCNGTQILVTLNKMMKCNSLALNGSDFTISPPAALIASAVGIGCANSFDMDSLLITFNQPLPYNNYDLVIQKGTDGNTLLDNCNTGVPVGESIVFSVISPLPVPMDSIRTNQCVTDSLELFFRSSLKCSSVATDGSDFFVTGTYPVSISGARAVNCINGLTRHIVVYITSTIQQPGNFDLVLKVGSDGNTLLSECDSPTVAGSTLAFKVLPKPVPDFLIPPSVCLPNARVTFINLSSIADGTENVFRYLWNFDDPASGANNSSIAKTPVHLYTSPGPFNVNLQVTSGAGCVKDTTIAVNTIHPQPKTDFGFNKPAFCLGDAVIFIDSTDAMDGITTQWNWNLGDGSLQHVPVFAYTYGAEQTYAISLYTMNSYGCYSDKLTKTITVYPYPVVNAGPDRFVLEGTIITIQPTVSGNDLQYLWTPDLYLINNHIASPRCISPAKDITYTLTVTARGGCEKSDQMFVKLLKAPKIPNTFTPNNDGINDVWDIQYLKDYPDSHVQVFTRTGQVIFESRGNYHPWNGTYKGRPVPLDTYFYIIEPGNGSDPVRGYVTIIR